MCTLTWWQGSGGRYEVFFNRDELKDRETALPPAIHEREGTRFLAPIDPRGSGTWLAANERGIVLALLNWYDATTTDGWPARWGSRGALVMALAGARHRDEVRSKMRGTRAEDYPPFRLIAFSPHEGAGLAIDAWQGGGSGELEPIDPIMPVSSSSFETEKVIGARKQRFKEIGLPTPETLWAYHHGNHEPASAGTVRMCRPDAQTWSISHITVTRDEVRFAYEAETPELAAPATRHVATLRREEAAR